MACKNYERIYYIVKHIPKGRVATYGQIASLAGLDGHARQVGYALSNLEDEKVPWHRVINAKGEISTRWDPILETDQMAKLEGEGITFDTSKKISLTKYRWKPKQTFTDE